MRQPKKHRTPLDTRRTPSTQTLLQLQKRSRHPKTTNAKLQKRNANTSTKNHATTQPSSHILQSQNPIVPRRHMQMKMDFVSFFRDLKKCCHHKECRYANNEETGTCMNGGGPHCGVYREWNTRLEAHLN